MAKKVTNKLDENDRPDLQHPDYDDLKAKRDVVRAVIGGVDRLLSNTDEYLPQYEGETDASYELRKSTATFNNYTKKAVKTLAGTVFEGEINISAVPEDIQKLCENIDKQGNHLNIFARKAFEESALIDGYGAIVVDTPSVVVKNRRLQDALDTNPFARLYCADSIWNWRYRINPVSQKKELEMVTFQETTQEKVGRFGLAEVIRYRVYELLADSVTLEVWVVNSETGEPEIERPRKTINASEITVAPVGELGSEPPLYDIAKKNVEHFQTYSLLKSDAHKTCVPQRVIEGGSAESIAPIGGDVTLFPPLGHKAYFIEVAGSSLEFVRSLCKDIASDIAQMTSSIISSQPQMDPQKTATEVVTDSAQETAELKPMAETFKDTLERMLGFFAELMNKGQDAGGSIVLGTAWAIAEQRQQEQAERDVQAHEANVTKTLADAEKQN
jgi:hypothetical protein